MHQNTLSKKVLKILGVNLLLAVLFLGSVELALNLYSDFTFEQRVAEINGHFGFPLNQMGSIENPFFGSFTAHPFWGHTLNPSMGANNLGFDSKENFPIKKDENVYQIGIFGGSVAQGLGRYFTFSEPPKKIELQICGVKKPVKITNYALGAYKQPQQFNVFHTFMEDVDLAINLDGNNEMIFESGLSYPVYYPTFFQDMFLVNNAKLKIINRIFDSKKVEYHLLKTLIDHSWLLHSQIIYKTSVALIQKIENENFDLDVHMRTSTSIPGETMDTRMQEKLKIWKKYLKLHSQISKANGIVSLFFVQPTQYLPQSKVLTENEKINAIVQDPHQVEFRQKSFEALAAEIKNLQKERYKVFDLLKLFASDKNEVFIDNMCHLNGYGTEIMAAKILEIVQKEINQLPCKSGKPVVN